MSHRTPNLLLKELPRELQVGDKIRYRDGLITFEWDVAGVDYNYGEADRIWLTHFDEATDTFADFWLPRRKLKEWLAQPGIAALISYEGC